MAVSPKLFISLLLQFIFLLFLSSPAFSNEPDFERGKLIYAESCAACHGLTGDGKGPASAAIRDKKPRDFTKDSFKYGSSRQELFATITKGIPGTAMPSWESIPEKDRKDVVYYILLEFRNSKSEIATN